MSARSTVLRCSLSLTLAVLASAGFCFQKPTHPPLPNFDQRRERVLLPAPVAQSRAGAVDRLRAQLAHARIAFDPVLGTPRLVSATDGFLSGPNGAGRGVSAAVAAGFAAGEEHRGVKAFLKEHRDLFGHGPEALASARIKREFTTPNTGLRTVMWEQQLDGIPVFDGTLIAHATRNGEL